jgi:Helix-turn-helix domain/Sigma-70, region 4
MDQLLKPTEAADLAGVSVATLHKWCAGGEGPPVLRPRRCLLRFERGALTDWLAARARAAAEAAAAQASASQARARQRVPWSVAIDATVRGDLEGTSQDRGWEPELTLEQVGEQLGTTGARVRQIEQCALTKVRCALELQERLGVASSPVLEQLRGKSLRHFKAALRELEAPASPA